MLKAVRFDEKEHKELLSYVADFRDPKGRKNESEAIRTLMQLGLNSLNTKEEPAPAIDIDKIKSDLFAQIMAALPQQSQPEPVITQQIQKPQEPSIRRVHENLTTTVEEVKVEEEQPRPKPTIDVAANPLLANLLGNVNK